MEICEINRVIEKIRNCESRNCNNNCYNLQIDKCLYFEPKDRIKFMLISESPHNYPRSACESSDDFIKKDFLPGCCERLDKNGAPKDIFAFIYDTFKPIFLDKPYDKEEFFKNVYWTHFGKKPPIRIKGKTIKSTFNYCAGLHLWNEIKAVHPQLIIIASGLACEFLLGKRYKECIEKQKKQLENNCTLKIKESQIIVFPNPSPNNGKCKKQFYRNYESGRQLKKIIEQLL